jgi:hypothetical protein
MGDRRNSSLRVSASLRLILLLASCTLACSVPNLEQPECDQARDAVREFYSFHFGNDMTLSQENLEKRRVYLSPDFYAKLAATPPAIDPFTLTKDQPKAFRAGECKVLETGRLVNFELLLFWKTDTRTEQRAIHVNAESRDGKWLIASVDE